MKEANIIHEYNYNDFLFFSLKILKNYNYLVRFFCFFKLTYYFLGTSSISGDGYKYVQWEWKAADQEEEGRFLQS